MSVPDIKLIIADMDGTLLDDNKVLDPRFWAMEEKLNASGIIFSIASGRQYFNLLQKFERIGDRMLILAENGTLVMHNGKELHVNSLEREFAHRFIRLAREISGAHIVLCGKESAYVEDMDERFFQEANQYYTRLERVNDLTEVNDVVLKVAICHFGGAQEYLYPHFLPYENDFKIALAGKIWLDTIHHSANKGTAIANIQRELGISYDQTMVFGDFLNDLEMMQTAKFSYAMKNAHPEILKVSNFVTEFDNNHQGVLDTIYKVCFKETVDFK